MLHEDRRRYVLAGCCGAGLLLAGVPAQAQPDPLRPVQMASDVWFVQGESALGSTANRNFISNAAFVVTREGVVVIDALGSPGLAEALLAAIRRVTPQSVRYVIVTHYHADHIYGLQAFKAAGATIVAHAGDCQVVFAGGSQAESVAGILAALRGSPVLTITDAALDEDAKGIVHFVLRDNRVRFEIDEQAASENGLAVSSKVLSLAVAVRPRL